MKFALLGWNYRKTPIETREKLALSESDREVWTKMLFEAIDLKELVILSTCNRVEFYLVAAHPQEAVQRIKQMLIQSLKITELDNYAYQYFDIEAVNYLFRVTSSLDSMIIGEPQIQGQVKSAFQEFSERETIGPFFKGLFPRAFSTAKRVRTETKMAHFAVSISFAAVELAKRIFDSLPQQTVMVIGAGEMAELAAKHFIKNGVTKLLVTNRTFSNAVVLAEQYQGSAIRFEQMTDYLEKSDIVISSTGAQDFIITREMVKPVVKRRKGAPMFLIDIAVPRDIDPRLNSLSNVYCYDIDDLQNVVDNNRKEREQQAKIAEGIVGEEVEKLETWFKNLSVVPTIRQLRNSFQEVADLELERSMQKLQSMPDEQQEQVKRLLSNVVNKLLHKPSTNLRKFGNSDDGPLYVDTVSQLFELTPQNLSVEEPSTPPTLKLLHSNHSKSSR